MAVLRDTVFPLADYASGTRTFGPLNIQNDVVRMRFEVARCTTADPTIWPNAVTTLHLDLEFSPDNGNTWRALGGFGAAGGITTDFHGGESSLTYCVMDLPAGTQRRMRGTVTIDAGPLRSSASLATSNVVGELP